MQTMGPTVLTTNAATVHAILAMVSPAGQPRVCSGFLESKLLGAVLDGSNMKTGDEPVSIPFLDGQDSARRELVAAALAIATTFERLTAVLSGTPMLTLPTPRQLMERERCQRN